MEDLTPVPQKWVSLASDEVLSRDPVTPTTTAPYVSLYSYVGSRPTYLVDPTGLRWCDPLCAVPDAAEHSVEAIGEATQSLDADLYLGVAATICVVGAAGTGGLSCAALAAAALTTSLSRAAVESGVVGEGPANYCHFALSAGTSVGLLKAAHYVNSNLWVPFFVAGKNDRRLLLGTTELSGTTADSVANVGFGTLCGSDSGAIGIPGASGK